MQLVCLYAEELYAEEEPAKFERAALRWHPRFVSEAAPSLLRAQIALMALGELRAGSESAKNVLLGLAGTREQ